MSVDLESSTVERAWIDLLAQNPEEGFTRAELLEHLKNSYSLDIKPGKLQVHLAAGYTACKPKLAIIPHSSPHRYIKGEEMKNKKDLKGGLENGGNGLKDLQPPVDGTAPEATPLADGGSPAVKEDGIKDHDRINMILIFRGMLRDHGFEQAAKNEGCDFRFSKNDLETEAASEPAKFQARFDNFEAVMVVSGLKELFDACSEIKGVCLRNFPALIKFMGREEAEELRKLAKKNIGDLRKSPREELLPLLETVRQAVGEYEEYEKNRRAPKPPVNLGLGRFGRKSDATGKTEASGAEGKKEEKQDQHQSATGGETEGPASNPPSPTPLPGPASSTDEPTPEEGEEDGLIAQLKKDLAASRQEVGNLTQARDQIQLKFNTANGQVATLQDELKVANQARNTAEGARTALQASLDADKQAPRAAEKAALEGDLTAAKTKCTELEDKVATLEEEKKKVAVVVPTAPVVPPNRLARLQGLGGRMIAALVLLITIFLFVVWYLPSTKELRVHNKPAGPAKALEATTDTRSEATQKLQQELDGEFQAFRTATQKGEAQ